MGRRATWNKGDIGWVAANPEWQDERSYGLEDGTAPEKWAWEFLRRNESYRRTVSSADSASAPNWGLAELVDYGTTANDFGSLDAPKWLALRSYEVIVGPRNDLPPLVNGQIAILLDLRRKVPKQVLQRQFGELLEQLDRQVAVRQAHVAVAPTRRGGRPNDARSLLLYLRFADAVASKPSITSKELVTELGVSSDRASKRMHDVFGHVRSLIRDRQYMRLIDLALTAKRRTAPGLLVPEVPGSSWDAPTPPPTTPFPHGRARRDAVLNIQPPQSPSWD